MSIYQKFFFFALGLLIALLGFSIPNIIIEIILVLVGLYIIVGSFTGDMKFAFSKTNAVKSKMDDSKDIDLDIGTPISNISKSKSISKNKKEGAKSSTSPRSKKTTKKASSASSSRTVTASKSTSKNTTQKRSKTTPKKTSKKA